MGLKLRYRKSAAAKILLCFLSASCRFKGTYVKLIIFSPVAKEKVTQTTKYGQNDHDFHYQKDL